ncbi:MAG: flagellar biosynthetic protein FliO [Thermodesulfovibrionales bacterium]|nr:flagellar biosynthetic protein FliO [Thermodesulfovibrionales bacterium]
MTDLYLQMIFALIGVLSLLLGITYFLKKKQVKQGIFKILSYQSFGTKKAIVAIQIGKEILIIGITPSDLKLLKTYQEKELEPDSVKELNEKLIRLKNIKESLYESK